jgi:ribosome-binding factor A
MSRRTEQVAEAIKEDVSILIQREIKDPRLGFVTVTRVEVTPDLKLAKVFFSTIGDEEVRKQSLKVLKGAAGFLRRELSHQLTLRYTPELYFYFDAALEQGEKIQRLMLEIEQEEKERAATATTDVSDSPAS